MKTKIIFTLSVFFIILIFSCKVKKDIISEDDKPQDTTQTLITSDTLNFEYTNQEGCDGKIYPNPKTSKYVLPYLPKISWQTGLTNCSSSYHGPGQPDRYAFDFNMPVGTYFYACRGGKVVYVVNDQNSNGGGSGNWCVIDHLDNTFGIYLHSPKNGVLVSEGDNIVQGQLLGKTGRSGLAGYPHLHFIVTQNGYSWPYDPIPITFRNVYPADVILKSNTVYLACDYK